MYFLLYKRIKKIELILKILIIILNNFMVLLSNNIFIYDNDLQEVYELEKFIILYLTDYIKEDNIYVINSNLNGEITNF